MKYNRIFRATISAVLALVLVVQAVGPCFAASTIERTVRDAQIGGERSRLFNDGWRFQIDNSGTDAALSAVDYDDTKWDEVTLPHDWLIKQIKDNSIAGLYKTDIGWYRKTFYLPGGTRGKNVAMRFDGVYMDSTVFVNGVQIGNWPNGYNTFEFDITPHLNYGNVPNVVAVKINYEDPNTRWYSGAGIYRDVYLTVTDPVKVNFNGTYISTNGSAVTVDTEVRNASDSPRDVQVAQTVLDASGSPVATNMSAAFQVAAGTIVTDQQVLNVLSPHLWNLDDTYLYTMKTEVKDANGTLLDTYLSAFGFRTIRLDPNEGFFLNGQYMKLKGVCMHHDLGALGSTMNYRALERNLQIMKDMGVNAIRTSHNMPAPQFVDICDRLGILLFSEAFDVWTWAKKSKDYARFFDVTSTADLSLIPNASAQAKWSEVDVRNWVRRDRNHPSMIMWSIGNEIGDQTVAAGQQTTRNLVSWVESEDPRGNAYPTLATCSMDIVRDETVRAMNFAELDVIGYNYSEAAYDTDHADHPDKVLFGSETSSARRSRGVYIAADGQRSNYSIAGTSGDLESRWAVDRDRKFILGQFVWTGIDYIGESATKVSHFGTVDTAGLPTDAFYFYQSVWSDKPMAHLLPYWSDSLGDTIKVWAYSTQDKMELFKDGISLGTRTVEHASSSVLHAEWEVPYSPGVVMLKAYDEDGNVVATDEISSFGPPASVALSADRASITADGKDLVFVTASITDASGNFVADSEAEVTFKVTGAGRLVGTDNGNTVDYDSYQSPIRKAFSGKVVAIVQSDGRPGQITITAEGDGLSADLVTVNSVREQAVTDVTLSGIDGIDAITSLRGTLAMVADIQPSNADCESVSYIVTEPDGTPTDKAVINKNGVLEALKNGQVKVTAIAEDGSGISGSAIVIISGQKAFTPVNKITVSAPSNFIEVRHGTLQMSADVAPADASLRRIVWSVESAEDPSAATINSSSGLLQAEYNGQVTVRATAADGSGIYDEFTITISLQNILPTRSPYTVTPAADYANKQGDSIVVEADGALGGIAAGNSLTYGLFAFGKAGTQALKITAATPGEAGTDAVPIELHLGDPSGELLATLWFEKTGDHNTFAERTFAIPMLQGNSNVSFVFPNETIRIESFVFMLPPARDPYMESILATAYDSTTSSTVWPEGDGLGGFMPGDSVTYERLDFGEEGAVRIKMSVCSPAAITPIEMYLEGPNGPLFTTLMLAQTGGSWNVYAERTFVIPLLKDVQNITFRLPNGGFQMKSFVFEKATSKPSFRDPYVSTVASSYHEKIGGSVTETWDGDGVEGFGTGDSVTYHYFGFGSNGAEAIRIFGSNTGTQPVPIRLHLVGDGGPVLGTFLFPATGDKEAFVGMTFALPKIVGDQSISFEFPEGGPFVLRDFLFMQSGYAVRDPYSVTAAASFDGQVGDSHEEQGGMGGFWLGSGLIYSGFKFGMNGSQTIRFTGSTAGESMPVEMRLGGPDGAVLATFQFTSTGGWGLWVTREFEIPKLWGDLDLCFIFPNGAMQIKDFQFIETVPQGSGLTATPLALDTAGGTKYGVSSTIHNYDDEMVPNVIFALYSGDGRLMDVKSINSVSVAKGADVSFAAEFDVRDDLGGAFVKMFIWDSEYVPLMAAHTAGT
ncbi:MAG: carbohydrate-binding protein [Oscillospiraceae bacterium]|nr:carbohydrate-binding protein [Oscillospiraceae bacterium]